MFCDTMPLFFIFHVHVTLFVLYILIHHMNFLVSIITIYRVMVGFSPTLLNCSFYFLFLLTLTLPADRVQLFLFWWLLPACDNWSLVNFSELFFWLCFCFFFPILDCNVFWNNVGFVRIDVSMVTMSVYLLTPQPLVMVLVNVKALYVEPQDFLSYDITTKHGFWSTQQ